mmetsp:Transcript_20097/g.50714  ORF Transcript_20097/g.50714 Transcript_20097/m.50714 type:complete len:127 (-) Transcript_20097:280-660(-)
MRMSSIPSVGGVEPYPFHHFHARLHPPENRVLPVQMVAGCEGDEKLRPIAVRPSVRHGKNGHENYAEELLVSRMRFTCGTSPVATTFRSFVKSSKSSCSLVSNRKSCTFRMSSVISRDASGIDPTP